jgi:GGDEF domain-containing protein
VFIKLGGMEAFQRSNGTLKVDETIYGLAQAIRGAIRRPDILTRYDEDMFAVILPFTGQNAVVVADRVSKALSSWLEQQRGLGEACSLTPGTGVAIYPFEAQHPTPLARLAKERTSQEALFLKRAA